MSCNDDIKWADVDSETRKDLSNYLWDGVYRPAKKGWRCRAPEDELLDALGALCREIDDNEKGEKSQIEVALRGVIELASTSLKWEMTALGRPPEGNGKPGSSNREQAELLVAEKLSELADEYRDDRDEEIS